MTLSIGALAISVFGSSEGNSYSTWCTGISRFRSYGRVRRIANSHVMGNASARFFNEKGVRAFRRSHFYSAEMEAENKQVFSGTAREAIGVFPTGLNVAVAASLATVGPEKLQVTMESTPRFAAGDRQRVEIQNDQVHAVVDVFSATSEIAGWSVVATLQNIVSPIVF